MTATDPLVLLKLIVDAYDALVSEEADRYPQDPRLLEAARGALAGWIDDARKILRPKR
jgi:hypothetical protein